MYTLYSIVLAIMWLYILTVYLVSGMVHLVFGKIPKNKLYFAATLLCGVVQLPQLLSDISRPSLVRVELIDQKEQEIE